MNGIIVINKEKGVTSHDVVIQLRKMLQEKKIGHTGTLDPNATGVLPLLIGEGTKLSQYLIEHDKEYIVTLELGVQTSTGDSEGTIIKQEENLKMPNKEKIQSVLQSFMGKQIQTPPIYSAIKVKGKKLYEYAREGKSVEIPKREIEIYQIDLLAIKDHIIKFHVACSKGTYIRSLCEEIANCLGTIGYMKELERTRVGRFLLEDACTIQELGIKNIKEHIITIQDFFKEQPNIMLQSYELKTFYNGVKIAINHCNANIVNVYYKNTWLGIAKQINEKETNYIKREIIVKELETLKT